MAQYPLYIQGIKDIWEQILARIGMDWDAQIQAKIYMVPLLLAMGSGFFFIGQSDPDVIRSFLLMFLCGAMAFWLWPFYKINGEYMIAILLFLAMMFSLAGYTAAALRTQIVYAPMISEQMGDQKKPIRLYGRIAGLEQLSNVAGGDGGIRMMMTDLVIQGMPQDETSRSLRLSLRKGGHDLRVGQRIEVLAKVQPPSPPTTPGGFDFRRDAYFKQIGGYGYIVKILRVDDPIGSTGTGLSWAEDLRNTLAQRVHDVLPARGAGMVSALLTGERAGIEPADWDALRNSGLAHLLAISGANVDMVAAVVFFTLRLLLAAIPRIALFYPIKKIAAAAALLTAGLYVAFILPSVPTLRALVMVTLVLGAVMLDRSPFSLRLVAVCAALILILQPEQILGPSFQLSFAAVTALVALFEWARPWLSRVHQDANMLTRLIIYVVGVCVTTAIATIATAPISLYHFQTLPLYGVLANVLAVPIMTFFVMPLSLVTYILMPIGLDRGILSLMGWFCDVILSIAHMIADLPGALLTPPAMPFGAFLGIVIAGVMLCTLMGVLRVLALVPLAVSVIIWVSTPLPIAAVLAEGKVLIYRTPEGHVISTTKRFARRQQQDWAQYWGQDKDHIQKAYTAEGDIPPANLLDMQKKIAKQPGLNKTGYAIYQERDGRLSAVPIYTPLGRVWEE